MGKNLSTYERNRLYLNHQGRSFIDSSFASGADIDADSRSVIAADFDRDGMPDLLVGSVGGGPLRMFHNRFPHETNWVQLDLTGVLSNRSAIGTRVVAVCGNRRIVRDLFTANGLMGLAPPELQIGVGQAESIDRLIIRWPTGQIQEFPDVPVNQRISIKEGESSFTVSPLAAAQVRSP